MFLVSAKCKHSCSVAKGFWHFKVNFALQLKKTCKWSTNQYENLLCYWQSISVWINSRWNYFNIKKKIFKKIKLFTSIKLYPLYHISFGTHNLWAKSFHCVKKEKVSYYQLKAANDPQCSSRVTTTPWLLVPQSAPSKKGRWSCNKCHYFRSLRVAPYYMRVVSVLPIACRPLRNGKIPCILWQKYLLLQTHPSSYHLTCTKV